MESEDEALLVLARSGAPAPALRALLDACGGGAAALRAGAPAWRAVGLSQDCQARLRAPDPRQFDLDRAWLSASPRHRVLAWHQADYPPLLADAPGPPALLFLVGDPDLLWQPQVAIVGSRNPGPGGLEHARRFGRAFGLAGFAVTSGLAAGIDAAAHRGALETGRTVAVLGTGPDRVFPRSNAAMFERIAAEGLLVTEHPPGTPGLPSHFPARNRLVAGLSLGTVVVEAALLSGALITARLATQAGREVFALPGSIDNPLARGCHQLIREGAGLAETPDEVIDALGPLAGRLAEALQRRLDGERPADAASANAEAALGADAAAAVGTAWAVPKGRPVTESASVAAAGSAAERRLLAALGHDPVNLDQLCQRTGLTVGPLSAMLLAMELNGKIIAAHGRYVRRS